LNATNGKPMLLFKTSTGRVSRHDVGTLDERRYIKVMISSNTPCLAQNGKTSDMADTLACFFKTPRDYANMLNPPNEIYTEVYNAWFARTRAIVQNNDKVPPRMTRPLYADVFTVDATKFPTVVDAKITQHAKCDFQNTLWQRNGRNFEAVASG
jgi:hypothetical protein